MYALGNGQRVCKVKAKTCKTTSNVARVHLNKVCGICMYVYVCVCFVMSDVLLCCVFKSATLHLTACPFTYGAIAPPKK